MYNGQQLVGFMIFILFWGTIGYIGLFIYSKISINYYKFNQLQIVKNKYKELSKLNSIELILNNVSKLEVTTDIRTVIDYGNSTEDQNLVDWLIELRNIAS